MASQTACHTQRLVAVNYKAAAAASGWGRRGGDDVWHNDVTAAQVRPDLLNSVTAPSVDMLTAWVVSSAGRPPR